MSESPSHKPPPARPPESEVPPGGRPEPVPARGRREKAEKSGRRGRRGRHRRLSGPTPTPARESAHTDAPAPSVEPDLAEARLEVDGVEWTVRVMGRSGGGSGGSAPLLLLGFWSAEAAEEPPALEATVVARTLAELSWESLETALSRADAPPDPSRKTTFFDDVSRGRRR